MPKGIMTTLKKDTDMYEVVFTFVLATRLVSYGPDEIDEADDDEDSGESLPSVYNVHNFQAVSRSCTCYFSVPTNAIIISHMAIVH